MLRADFTKWKLSKLLTGYCRKLSFDISKIYNLTIKHFHSNEAYENLRDHSDLHTIMDRCLHVLHLRMRPVEVSRPKFGLMEQRAYRIQQTKLRIEVAFFFFSWVVNAYLYVQQALSFRTCGISRYAGLTKAIPIRNLVFHLLFVDGYISQ